jgi:hypothetical protein
MRIVRGWATASRGSSYFVYGAVALLAAIQTEVIVRWERYLEASSVRTTES